MKTHLLSIFLFLALAACQQGSSSQRAIPVTGPTAPARTQGPTPTINIVTLVPPTRPLDETRVETTSVPTLPPLPSPTVGSDGDRPLLIPRILQSEYTTQSTQLVIGLDIHPIQLSKPGISGEVYDATLKDQAGREIPAISIEMSRPDQVILKFAPLPPGVASLTLRAQTALRGVPALAPLAIDVSRHPLDESWPIQIQVHFGEMAVRLHTARLTRNETGPPDDLKQQLILELWGENADLKGAQLVCLYLAPLPPQTEGEMSCGQESGGISATVSLGPVVGRSAPLPMPTGLVMLQASADFLLPGTWVTTWPVEK